MGRICFNCQKKNAEVVCQPIGIAINEHYDFEYLCFDCSETFRD